MQTFQFTQYDWQQFGKHLLHSFRTSFSDSSFEGPCVLPVKPRVSKPKPLNSLKVPDRKMTLIPTPLSNTEIPRKVSLGLKKTIPLTKYPQKRTSLNR